MNFQIKQCEIKIEYLFFAVIAFLLLTDTTGVALLGIAATVLHEAGHLVMMLLLGGSVKTVRFHAFGVDIEETGRGRRSYLSDALVALAGPFANMIFCVASAVLYSFWPNHLVWEFIFVNSTIAWFNILPVEALDGGQALYALLCNKFSQKTSETIVAVVSFFALLPVAIIGFMMLLQSKHNFTLFFISIYLMVLLVLKRGRFF